MATIPQRGVPDLLSELIREVVTLLRGEVRLAGAEVSAKISSLGTALGLLIGAAVLAMAALVIFLEAAVAGLIDRGFTPTAATLIVGVVVLIVAAILLMIGLSRLKARHLTPNRTIEQLQRDAALAREQVTPR